MRARAVGAKAVNKVPQFGEVQGSPFRLLFTWVSEHEVPTVSEVLG